MVASVRDLPREVVCEGAVLSPAQPPFPQRLDQILSGRLETCYPVMVLGTEVIAISQFPMTLQIGWSPRLSRMDMHACNICVPDLCVLSSVMLFQVRESVSEFVVQLEWPTVCM